jgi:hypothetical protein
MTSDIFNHVGKKLQNYKFSSKHYWRLLDLLVLLDELRIHTDAHMSTEMLAWVRRRELICFNEEN